MSAPELDAVPRIVLPPKSAYYVVAPPYVRTSAGIKAMHLLCHALNRVGQRAYMVIHPFLREFSPTHPDLLTPLLSRDAIQADFERGLTPVVVYPETISGNPLRAPFVVRYVMNFPGLLGGDAQFPPEELRFGYAATLAEAAGARENVLFIPASDIDIFKTEPRVERQGTCFFAGKYRDFHRGELLPITSQSIEITRDRKDSPSPAQIAELFRRSELFYCYENSALAIEALLCECPVVFLPNEHLTRVIAEKELGLDGVAWGAESQEIARAKATAAQGRRNYLRTYRDFWSQLDRFIATTQRAVAAVRYTAPIRAEKINRVPPFQELKRMVHLIAFVYKRYGIRRVVMGGLRRIWRFAKGGTGNPPQPRW